MRGELEGIKEKEKYSCGSGKERERRDGLKRQLFRLKGRKDEGREKEIGIHGEKSRKGERRGKKAKTKRKVNRWRKGEI